jgi:hypothetical protein
VSISSCGDKESQSRSKVEDAKKMIMQSLLAKQKPLPAQTSKKQMFDDDSLQINGPVTEETKLVDFSNQHLY